ncbi:MAG TPA: Uma2 family endonuclease [Thiothrix sp.]|nr:Uma2 family endonuclease [Thiothrix sp.]
MEWSEVIDNPFLQNLPFKIEMDKWGKILMSPAGNNHGNLQYEVGKTIDREKKSGKIIIECSIQTPEGVKVADVAWASDEFIAEHGFRTPYKVSPEIVVEVVSPSNTKKEMAFKTNLYLNQGAREVWLVDEKGVITYFSDAGRIEESGEV